MHDLEKAKASYQTAIDLNPNEPVFYRNLALAYAATARTGAEEHTAQAAVPGAAPSAAVKTSDAAAE